MFVFLDVSMFVTCGSGLPLYITLSLKTLNMSNILFNELYQRGFKNKYSSKKIKYLQRNNDKITTQNALH